jgi:hypothetical protein
MMEYLCWLNSELTKSVITQKQYRNIHVIHTLRKCIHNYTYAEPCGQASTYACMHARMRARAHTHSLLNANTLKMIKLFFFKCEHLLPFTSCLFSSQKFFLTTKCKQIELLTYPEYGPIMIVTINNRVVLYCELSQLPSSMKTQCI